MHQPRHYQVLIVGGGTAGISVAARLTRGWGTRPQVAIVEPSADHFYQPYWTLVGAGIGNKEQTRRPEATVIPKRATWIRDAIQEFLPAENAVTTRSGERITYDWLVVAAGLQLNWNQIPGLKAALGQHGVCSNYSYQTVDSTWQALQSFHGGVALFTQPSGAVKCGGAPQKIMYLADDYWRRQGVRDKAEVRFCSALSSLFAVEKYRRTLEGVVARKGILCQFQTELIEVRGPQQQAVFRNVATGELKIQPFDFLHVTPPMGPPDFIAHSPLADASGWLEVDPATLRHTRFDNVFGLGDCSNLPTSKTGAAIRKQAPVVVRNLLAAMRGQVLPARYDGYTSCPLVTGYGKMVLAEFNYQKQPAETFPFDQSRERWSMWILKRYLLPWLYWQGMLKGRA